MRYVCLVVVCLIECTVLCFLFCFLFRFVLGFFGSFYSPGKVSNIQLGTQKSVETKPKSDQACRSNNQFIWITEDRGLCQHHGMWPPKYRLWDALTTVSSNKLQKEKKKNNTAHRDGKGTYTLRWKRHINQLQFMDFICSAKTIEFF